MWATVKRDMKTVNGKLSETFNKSAHTCKFSSITMINEERKCVFCKVLSSFQLSASVFIKKIYRKLLDLHLVMIAGSDTISRN